MPITGDGPRQLAQMIREMGELSHGRAIAPLTKALAHETIVRVKDCFDKSESPYGAKYAPVSRGGKPLLDTARLRNAFLDNSSPGRIELNNPTIYAKLMNYGGTVTAKRAPYLVFKVKGQRMGSVVRGGRVTSYAYGRTSNWVRVKSVTIKARPFFPDARGLPLSWETRLEAVARDTFAKRYPSLAR